MQLTTMFIRPVNMDRFYKKDYLLGLWNAGKAFENIVGSEILSINSIEVYRDQYDRICIQYDMGIIEV